MEMVIQGNKIRVIPENGNYWYSLPHKMIEPKKVETLMVRRLEAIGNEYPQRSPNFC